MVFLRTVSRILCVFPFLSVSQAQINLTSEPRPEWIWRADQLDDEPIYLRKQFEITDGLKSADLFMTCDNEATIFLNGVEVGSVKEWEKGLNLGGI